MACGLEKVCADIMLAPSGMSIGAAAMPNGPIMLMGFIIGLAMVMGFIMVKGFIIGFIGWPMPNCA